MSENEGPKSRVTMIVLLDGVPFMNQIADTSMPTLPEMQAENMRRVVAELARIIVRSIVVPPTPMGEA